MPAGSDPPTHRSASPNSLSTMALTLTKRACSRGGIGTYALSVPTTHVHGCFMRVANGEPVILEYRAHGRGFSVLRLCVLMQPCDPSLELPAHTRVWAVTERWGRGQGPVSARSLSRPLAPRWYAPAFLGPFWVETRLGHLFHDDMHPRRRTTAGRAPRRRDRQPVRLGRFQP